MFTGPFDGPKPRSAGPSCYTFRCSIECRLQGEVFIWRVRPAKRGNPILFVVLLAILFIVLLVFTLSILHALFSIVLFLVIAGLCAAAAEYFLGHREGVGETLLIGLIGAALGVILATVLHLPRLSVAGVPIIWTIVGSLVIVGILKLARGPNRSLRRL